MDAPPLELGEAAARELRLAHEERVDRWVRPHLERRSRGFAHPVKDFLFTYYAASPAALRRWHPGPGLAVGGAEGELVAQVGGYRMAHGLAVVDESVLAARAERIAWIERLLSATAARRPVLSCFGLHEWAMVYRAGRARRHVDYPLRLGERGTDAVVEAHDLCCTHHDALRFFTAEALPLNPARPNRQTQHEFEQPGCLHATMDLYKWAGKMVPLVGAETIADCFELARDVRELDMRASPYDLSSLGYQPVEIETAAGKAEYVNAQRSFALRAAPLRQRLIDACAAWLPTGNSARI